MKRTRTAKHIFSLTIVLVMILSLATPAHAAIYSYPVNGGNIKFDPTTGTITGCDNSIYEANIPAAIEGIPVTGIKYSAFGYLAKKLNKVTIPSSITEIGKGAFFQSYLKMVSIPDSVTRICEHAFALSKLESVTIPGSVEVIERTAFSKCGNLRTLTLQEGVKVLGNSAFSSGVLETVTLPDSIEEIGREAFYEQKKLTSVTIGSNIQYIDDGAFNRCFELKEVYFRGDAPTVGKYIFGDTDGLIIYYPEGASGWTTPTWNGFISKSYTLTDTQPATPAPTPTPAPAPSPETPAAAKVTAVPYSSGVLVNGQEIAFDAYNINRNNYFKLRDLAFVLTGTNVQFNVTWDSARKGIAMTSGVAYVPVGGEMTGKGNGNQVGTAYTSSIYLDNSAIDLTAYTIQGNNYFKLRDIGALFNFSVEWDSANQRIVIDTSQPYVDG